MQSEFYNVALDRIRYSLVWEDSNTLYKALAIAPEDQVLVISSAGCNVLNALLKNPSRVTAIDLNPVQNKLLLLKKHIILNHDHSTFRALMGLEGSARVKAAWPCLESTLPGAEKSFWSSFFASHPEGLMAAGRLEAYLNNFYHTLDKRTQEKLQKLIQFKSISLQHGFYLKELHGTAFQQNFITYFDEANLSKGRDPKLFKYTEDSGGTTFYNRLMHHVSTVLLQHNFFFRFFFFGPEHLPEPILPPCYQDQNYNLLRENLHKLEVVHAEAIDYLLSPQGAAINKASLSNIFEYTSSQEFERVYTSLFPGSGRNLRVVFWNLLQQQGATFTNDQWHQKALSESLSQADGCFYFCNVRVQDTCPAPVIQDAEYRIKN